jgi:signal transduction histidine kinase
MKNTTKLIIFSTVSLTAAIVILYTLLIFDVSRDLREQGIDYRFTMETPVVIVVITALLAVVISSVVIDQILNPIRLMITKVREIEKMKFSSPLIIQTEDDELREYVSAFNSMSQHLSRYIERQKRFISDASHELTTPITVINGHTDLMLRRCLNQPDLMENSLKIVRTEALRMSELVDSLLLLARSDSAQQKYVFESHDIATLLNESAAEARLIAPAFTIYIKIETPVTLICDAYALKRVFRIVLSNAIKYAGKCDISVQASHGLAHIVFRDNGIGIAPEHLPNVFERFYRVDDSRTRKRSAPFYSENRLGEVSHGMKKTGSSGLGLAIAKEIIHAHGGDITAESEPGKGAAFRIVIPS